MHPRAKFLSDALSLGPSKAARNTLNLCFKDSGAEASRDRAKRSKCELGEVFWPQPVRTIPGQARVLGKCTE